MKLYSYISLTGNSAPRFYFLVATNNCVEFSFLIFHSPLFTKKHLKVRSQHWSFANFIPCLAFLPAPLKVGGIWLGFRTRCSHWQAECPLRSHSCFQGLRLLICEMSPIPPARVPARGCQEDQMRFTKVSLHTSWVPSTTMIPLSPFRGNSVLLLIKLIRQEWTGTLKTFRSVTAFFALWLTQAPHTPGQSPPPHLLAPACLS